MTQDSLLIAGNPADSQAINRYLYCRGNAIGRVDPSGSVDEVELELVLGFCVAVAALAGPEKLRPYFGVADVLIAGRALYNYENKKSKSDYIPGQYSNWGPHDPRNGWNPRGGVYIPGNGGNPDPPSNPAGFSWPRHHPSGS